MNPRVKAALKKTRLFRRYRALQLAAVLRPLGRVREAHGWAVVFVATPRHGNLGDQAIVLAQRRFFADMGLGDRIVEIPTETYLRHKEELMGRIGPEDLLVIDGGGNMGALWPREEQKIRDILTRFPRNPVLIFPQTLYYPDDAAGREGLAASVPAYNRHPKLLLCAREQASFAAMQAAYPAADVRLVPDMVLSLEGVSPPRRRTGVLLCLRDDHEGVLSDKVQADLLRELEERGLRWKKTSTLVPGQVHPRNRERLLRDKWREFAGARLVITDRLHGMLFAVLNGTPCIALDNASGKVGQVYRWIEALPSVAFLPAPAPIAPHLDRLLALEGWEMNREEIEARFREFRRAVKEWLPL